MEDSFQNALREITSQFLSRNYDYLWLRTMLEQAAAAETDGSTLITGSSHALNAIRESCWNSAYNCSMHSQDLYYDYQCARRVLGAATPGRFSRCFIVMGYYIAWQDLSLSKISRETMISKVYYPIFKDARHWETPACADPWDWLRINLPAGSDLTPELLRSTCEQAAVQILLQYGAYYSAIHPRGSYFNLGGRAWEQVPPAERLKMGKLRAEEHNKIFSHTESFEENKTVLREFIRFLYGHCVRPIVVITPFSPEYNLFVRPELRAGVEDLLEAVPEEIEYVDFNQIEGIFEPADFMDTDHLSESGAQKVSTLLAQTFGA